ncbi:MAG: single-stranded-DNA-specific exonuclease RecJ [Bacteroidales bacterium]|nr:single-stranded-DNA-specific exonuclease RecJ [Bacteroidales bacterium]
MQKRWKLKSKADEDIVKSLSQTCNINPIIAKILVQRGIDTFEKAKSFFRPSLDELYNPLLMKDIDIAVERLDKAIEKNEKILIYGDYDVDGTTSVALVYSFLKNYSENIDFYIPDRNSEGYGVSLKGIDFAKENKFSLIISLDCGIKAIEQIKYAKDSGIDFIVCDHHIQGNELPAAVAILDPKRKDCAYPFKELSGCGVGFKMLFAYCLKKNIPISNLYDYLDLVAISVCSDIVPITGENRILTYYGLQAINNCPRPGIKSLLDVSGFRKKASVNDVVFVIGPRINAAGRINTGRNAVELLISDDSERALEFAKEINYDNTTRRDLDKQITEEALQIIENSEELQKRKSTVLFNPSWHKGVIGIVASRVIETYYKPTIILTESEGLATGSARSIKDFDLYEALSACSDLLERFGGHKYAAGITMKKENIELFAEKFEKFVCKTITDELLIPEIEIDSEINFNDITLNFFKVIKQFAPFGPGNMKPLFKTGNVLDKGFARVVGENHLKLSLYQNNNKNKVFEAIAFNKADVLDKIQQNTSFSICYSIEENEWNGETKIQLNIKDFLWNI